FFITKTTKNYNYTLSLHDALPISLEINFELLETRIIKMKDELLNVINKKVKSYYWDFSLEVCKEIGSKKAGTSMATMNRFENLRDRKSTRLNSSHSQISYAVFCLK